MHPPAIRRKALLMLCLAFTLPAGRADAVPDPRYWRYDAVLAQFVQWEAEYPEIFHREMIGLTQEEGEAIWAVKISDQAIVPEPEARLLFHAAQHANEANGVNTIMKMIETLLAGYGSDPKITAWVDDLEIWFIPIVNVDGHRRTWTNLPNAANWRKNGRDNDDNHLPSCPEDGVDLNRNWDFRWAEYDSIAPSGYYYKGPAPFSESEAVALRDFIVRERPVFILDYHSPFLTNPGNLIYWPWKEDATGREGPDARFYKPISEELGRRTQSEVDTIYYNGRPASIDILPKEQNWVYSNFGTCILLMEISTRNWWAGAIVDTIAARTARGSLYLLGRALGGPGLAGRVADATTGEPIEAEISILEASHPRVGAHRSESRYGRYWRLLSPGDYTAAVSAAGYYDLVERVTVDSTIGWTERDFHLMPLAPAFVEESIRRSRPALAVSNPAAPGAEIRLDLPWPADVVLELFDIEGRRIAQLIQGRVGPGSRAVALPKRLAPGVYLVDLRAGDLRLSTKIVAVR